MDETTAQEPFDMDPQKEYPKLGLSGKTISANLCIPYQLYNNPGQEWGLQPREGALYDLFRHQASVTTPWKHILVGWTGEIQLGTQPFRTIDSLPSARPPVPENTSTVSMPYTQRKLSSLDAGKEVLTITKADRERLEKTLKRTASGKIIPVWLGEYDKDVVADLKLQGQSRWRYYADQRIRPLFHYQVDLAANSRDLKASWEDYVQINQAFADRIFEIYTPGDIIQVHDYNLALLPLMLRQRIAKAYISFSLYIPFPDAELVRTSPHRKDILEGMLGANLVVFQCPDYSQHFVTSCNKILGSDPTSTGVKVGDSHVSVEALPMGMDVTKIQSQAFDDAALQPYLGIVEREYSTKSIIIGCDRLDHVNGVIQKLIAFETFLIRYPQWASKAVLIQITNLDNTTVGDEKDLYFEKLQNSIASIASRINNKYGTQTHTPVVYFSQQLLPQAYYSLLRKADVALITPTREGFSTTSFEYAICQRDNHGPLVLSQSSASASNLRGVISVNPHNRLHVCESILHALEMSPEDREAQNALLYSDVITNTISQWSNRVSMSLLAKVNMSSHVNLIQVLDRLKFRETYSLSQKRLLMFDYDGTLTPIVSDPSAAIPTDHLRKLLQDLGSDPKNHVWIISGRDQQFLEHWLGDIASIGLSAEHGSFIRYPNHSEWEDLASETDMGWQGEVLGLFNFFTEQTPGSWVEKKKVALTWHYRNADTSLGVANADGCRHVLENTIVNRWDVEVMSGKANVEVRPVFLNKGAIAQRLLKQYNDGSSDPIDFVFCAGDDKTDEDMFRATLGSGLNRSQAYACTIGPATKQTLADWYLPEPADVVELIETLTTE